MKDLLLTYSLATIRACSMKSKVWTYITLMAITSLLYPVPTRAQMLVMLSGDTLRGPIKKLIEYTSWGQKTMYEWDTTNKIITCSIYLENRLGGKSILKYNNGYITEVISMCADGTVFERIKTSHDKATRLVQQRTTAYPTHYGITAGSCLSLINDGIIDCYPPIDIDSSMRTYKYKYDEQGRVLWKLDYYSKHKDGYITTETTEHIYQNLPTGNKEQKIHIYINASAYTADTTFEITNYTFHNKYTDKLVLEEGLRFSNSSSWPDTSISRKELQYDSSGNLIVEWEFSDYINYPKVHWQTDGREVNTKNTYSYDEHNNLIEEKSYFREDEADIPLQPKQFPGEHIGFGERHTYDSLNNHTSYTRFSIYLEKDGTEKEHFYPQRVTPVREKTVSETNTKKNSTVRDSYGNIIKKIYDNRIMFSYEIEYFE